MKDALSEHRIQAQLVTELQYLTHDRVMFYATPNQSNRHILNAVKMRAEGLMPGVADLSFVFDGGRIAFLEMKKPGGALSPAQKIFRAKCERLHTPYQVAFSVDEAIDVLKSWGALK